MYAEHMLKTIATVKQGLFNLLKCFLIAKVEHILDACLAGN
jgi:hypothetical protein